MFSYVALLSLFIALSAATTITSISPPKLPTTGGPLTGTGTSLNTPANAYISYTAGSTIEAGIAVAGNTFTVTVGPGTGASKPAFIYFNNFATEFFYVDLYSYYPPSITTVSLIPNDGGVITITGTNFGNSAGVISVVFTSYASQVFTCSSVVVTAHTQITCNMAMGVGNGTIKVTVDGQASNLYYAYFNDMCNAALSTTNRFINAKFEDSPSSWNTAGNVFFTSTATTLGCGAYSLRIPDYGEIGQSITLKNSGRYQLSGLFRLSQSTIYATAVSIIGITDCSWIGPFDTNNLWVMIRITCTGTPFSSSQSVYLRTSVSNVAVTYVDDLSMCYFGDPGCVYEVYSNGYFFPPFYPFLPDPAVFLNWVYQGKKCLKLVENNRAFAIISPLGSTPPAFSNIYVVACASTNIMVSFITPDVALRSVGTSWSTVSFSIATIYPTTVAFNITTGTTIYVAAIYYA